MFYVCYKLIKQRYNKYKLHWKYDDSTTRGQNKINTHAFSNLYIFLNDILNLWMSSIYGYWLSFAIEERRKKLYPIQKEARKQGKHVVLVRDKLFIDGMLYCGLSVRGGYSN